MFHIKSRTLLSSPLLSPPSLRPGLPSEICVFSVVLRRWCRCMVSTAPLIEINTDCPSTLMNNDDKSPVGNLPPLYSVSPVGDVPEEDIVEISSPSVAKAMGPIREIIFVGTGTSTSVPSVACLAEEPPSCLVCLDAAGRLKRTPAWLAKYGGPPPPTTPQMGGGSLNSDENGGSRNRRTNPSAIIRYAHSDGTLHSVLIDCGKTFYANALRTILRTGVRQLDGVILTHGHADALLGLDDLRHWAGHWPSIQSVVDIYCDEETFEVVRGTFPYLVNPRCATGGGEVGALRFHRFHAGKSFRIGELSVQSVPLWHGSHADGRPYYANGYVIEGLTYLSDLSGIPEESRALLTTRPTQVLVADCLFEELSYKSHYSWPQTAELISWLRPRASILVGMSHMIDYYVFQRKLIPSAAAADGSVGKIHHDDGNVYVGFDGLVMRFK